MRKATVSNDGMKRFSMTIKARIGLEEIALVIRENPKITSKKAILDEVKKQIEDYGLFWTVRMGDEQAEWDSDVEGYVSEETAMVLAKRMFPELV